MFIERKAIKLSSFIRGHIEATVSAMDEHQSTYTAKWVISPLLDMHSSPRIPQLHTVIPAWLLYLIWTLRKRQLLRRGSGAGVELPFGDPNSTRDEWIWILDPSRYYNLEAWYALLSLGIPEWRSLARFTLKVLPALPKAILFYVFMYLCVIG